MHDDGEHPRQRAQIVVCDPPSLPGTARGGTTAKAAHFLT
jgi:hypothetical protein